MGPRLTAPGQNLWWLLEETSIRLKVPGTNLVLLSWQQAQHSHHVIQQVLNHLDTHSKDAPRVRAGIVQVLLETVAIAAKGSVGEFQRKAGPWSWSQSWFLPGLMEQVRWLILELLVLMR